MTAAIERHFGREFLTEVDGAMKGLPALFRRSRHRVYVGFTKGDNAQKPSICGFLA